MTREKREQMTDEQSLTRAEIDELLDTRPMLTLTELAAVLGHSVGSVRVSRWRGTLGLSTKKVAGRWHVASDDVRCLIDPVDPDAQQKETA